MKEVLQGAKALPGLLALHQKDEKVWLEIRPEQFNQLLFFSYNVPRSVGERGLYGSQMGGAHAVVFRKVGNQVQLIAKNTEFLPKKARLRHSLSPSLFPTVCWPVPRWLPPRTRKARRC